MATAPDFTSVRASASPGKFSTFWRWWTGELANLVPERISMLGGGARAPMLALEDDAVRLIEPRGTMAGEESSAVLSGLDEPRRRVVVRALLERAGETRGRARLVLGRDEALVRRVSFPAATEENLAQVLAFEMDRLTPFKAEDVYFDYRVISRDPANGQVLVQIAVARRDLVDERLARLRGLGVSVQGVAVRDDVGHPAAPLDLMPSEQRGERESSRERAIQWLLLAAVAALFVVALLFPVWQKRETVIALLPLLAKDRQAAEATDAISRELEKQVGDFNFLLAKKHGTYPVLAYMEEISRLLPDNTWLSLMDVKTSGKTREISIAGETASASKLIEILEQSTLLQNAALRGSVTRGSQPGLERFQIAAEARARAQPEARPVMEAVSVVPPPPQPLPQPSPPDK
jgi:general secretion pathway protein L